MKRQEVFNKVWKHFVKNKAPKSVRSDGVCTYRGPRGTKCAAGVLIPDRLYKKNMENEHIFAVLRDNPTLRKHLKVTKTDEFDFIEELQFAHDLAANFESFHSRIADNLRDVAKRFNLRIPK